MKIVIIDGQGGKMGSSVIEQLRKKGVSGNIYAIGTNGIATSVMMKSGADFGATGENPVIVACRDADIIAGPVGIVIADSLFGEVTPRMSVAVAQSKAHKVLLPFNKCNTSIVCTDDKSSAEIINEAVDTIISLSRK